jgi:hypothetical protein
VDADLELLLVSVFFRADDLLHERAKTRSGAFRMPRC